MSKFKAGDTVICTDEFKDLGLLTVIDVYTEYGVKDYMYNLEDQKGNIIHCYEYSLEKIFPKYSFKFNVGDLVNIIRDKDLLFTIIERMSLDGVPIYLIETDDGDNRWYKQYYLEKAQIKNKFIKGDIIWFRNECAGFPITIVKEVNRTGYTLLDGFGIDFEEIDEYVELVPEEYIDVFTQAIEAYDNVCKRRDQAIENKQEHIREFVKLKNRIETFKKLYPEAGEML